MCNNFIKAVREPNFKKPNHDDFKAEYWSNYFRASNSRSLADQRLYKVGMWFHEHSKVIKKQREEIFNNLLATGINGNLLMLQFGMINFRASQIFSEYLATLHLDKLQITEVSELVRRAESVVDAARYPITKIAEYLTASSAQTKNSSPNIIVFLDSALSLEESYNLIEDLWSESLWNGWYIDDVQNKELVKPADLNKN